MTERPDAVFLDRDGTVMEDAHYIKSPAQVRLLPGAAAAIRTINDAGVPAIIVTNQSGIARGLITVDDYEAVRRRFESLLAAEGARIDATYYCPHHPSVSGACDCRKPGTRLFSNAIRDFNLDPAKVAYVGDRWRDVAPARRLGGRGILVKSPMTTEEDLRQAEGDGVETAGSITDAIEMLFGLTERDRSA